MKRILFSTLAAAAVAVSTFTAYPLLPARAAAAPAAAGIVARPVSTKCAVTPGVVRNVEYEDIVSITGVLTYPAHYQYIDGKKRRVAGGVLGGVTILVYTPGEKIPEEIVTDEETGEFAYDYEVTRKGLAVVKFVFPGDGSFKKSISYCKVYGPKKL